MSGRHRKPTLDTVSDDIRTDYEYLKEGCQTYGVTPLMFRTAKYLFHVAVLLFTVYLIETGGVDPMVASGVAIVLIAGPEGLETYLVRQGVLAASSEGNTNDSGE